MTSHTTGVKEVYDFAIYNRINTNTTTTVYRCYMSIKIAAQKEVFIQYI